MSGTEAGQAVKAELKRVMFNVSWAARRTSAELTLDLVLPVSSPLPAPRLAPARGWDSPPNLHRNDRRPGSLLSLPHCNRSRPRLAYPCERLSIGQRIRSVEYAVGVGRADGKCMAGRGSLPARETGGRPD
jgi:hypothetical protein